MKKTSSRREKRRNGERRIQSPGKEKPRKVEPSKIDPVVNAMMIRLVSEESVVPLLEVIVQEKVELDVHMGALARDSITGVTHDREFFPLPNDLAGRHRDRVEMRVEAVVGATAPTMLDHDIAAVVRSARRAIRVNDVAGGDRAHLVERLALRIPAHRPDVHPFVKPGVDRLTRDWFRIAHKTVLPAFPRMRNDAVHVALDDLIELGVSLGQEGVVIGRQRQVKRTFFRARRRCHQEQEKRASPGPALHFFLRPLTFQSFAISLMSACVSPAGR